jgi:hypothetical protein
MFKRPPARPQATKAPEARSLWGYVEDAFEPRTKLEAVFNILRGKMTRYGQTRKI